MRPSLATKTLSALALLALLGACAEERAASPPPGTAAPAPRPTGPVTTFDGRYSGTMTLNPDRTRACPAAAAAPREATVEQGRARFTVNPAIREVLTGTVGADGSVRMASNIDRSIATTGAFTADGFLGAHRNGLCTYSVNLRKVD